MAAPLQDIPDKDTVIYTAPDDSGMFSVVFFAFSTLVTIKGYGEQASEGAAETEYRRVAQAVVDQCRKYEWLLSRTLEGSDIFKLNSSSGEVIEVDHETWKALQQGIFYSAQSKGHFDITMGAITRLWDFNEGIIPDPNRIEEALEHVNWRNLELFDTKEALDTHYFAQLRDSEARVDLGGTAKGFIADSICERLKQEGITGAFVNLGGNVAVFGGKPDGSLWRIGIQSPFKNDELRGVMSLRDGSVVTSGLYERCFESDGQFYHHILDRKTGYPVQTDIAGVSVIANTSRDADGYSTTLFALGVEGALDFFENTKGIEGIIVTKDKDTRVSSGLLGATIY